MERLDLRFSPLGDVVIALTQARLYGGLATHRLRLSAKVSATWLSDDKAATAVLLTGSVSSSHQSPRFVADLAGDVLGLRRFAVSEDICVSLSDEQLHALDKERNGGDLVLDLHLVGTLLAAPDGLYPKAEGNVQVRVPESVWVQDLDQLGKVVGLTLRVPSPLVDPGGSPPSAAGLDDGAVASRAQAVARLRKARSLLIDGQLEPCAMMCRLSLDSLDLLDPIPEARDLPKPRERDMGERWGAIRHDVRSLLSGAVHDDEITRDFHWTRAQAEAALAMVGALITLSS